MKPSPTASATALRRGPRESGSIPRSEFIVGYPPVKESPRILVVDDSQDILTMLSHTLSRHGFLIDAATSSEEALARAATPAYAATVVDLVMPGDAVARGRAGLLELRERPLHDGQGGLEVARAMLVVDGPVPQGPPVALRSRPLPAPDRGGEVPAPPGARGQTQQRAHLQRVVVAR